jgi:adenosylcobinamide-GDP ribazoletransferase
MTSFWIALAFLTILPIRFRKLPSPQQVARSRLYYPVVGLLLGGLLGGWTALLVSLSLPVLSAFLILVGWVATTGMLHIDGFCDLCDGLFAAGSAEDRLQIMKDPHVGSFALVGGVLLLLGKFAALEGILARSAERGPWIVVAAVAMARCLVLFMAGVGRYPRPEGTGKILVEATTCGEAGLFALVASGITLALLFSYGAWRVLIVFAAAFLVVVILTSFCARRLGGITGDCLGAAIEASELTFLVTAVLAGLA